MTTPTFPPFRVEALVDGGALGRRMFYSSAGSARQAFAIAREELESLAKSVSIATEEGFAELLEGLAAISAKVPSTLLVGTDPSPDGAPYGYRLVFFPEDLGVLVELVSVAPITAAVPLVGPAPEERRRC